MTTQSLSRPLALPPGASRPGRAGEGALSLFLGLGFTVALFCGIAYFGRSHPSEPAPDFGEAGLTILPVEPPPPPKTQTETVPEIAPLAGFDLSPSESSVKIAATPPTMDLLRPEEASRAPTASIAFALPATFRPKPGLEIDPNHVYQRSEVDTHANLLIRNVPAVSERDMNDARVSHVTIIWIVEMDGSVSHVRLEKSSGNPRLDLLMMEMVKDSVFTPALKGNRKVREMTEQQMNIRWSGGSAFHD